MWPKKDDRKTLPDDLRCRRSDGRGWRCYGRRLDGAKYCEYHFNKMRVFHERFKGSEKLRGGHEISSSSKKQHVPSDHVEIKEKRRYRKRAIVELTAEGSSVKKLKPDQNRLALARSKARSVNRQSTSVGMTTIRQYCFKWPGIYVPVRFAKANGLFNRNCDVELEDEAGHHWPVKLWAKPYDGQVYLRKGWGDFQNAHGLQIGDEIQFELISGEEKPVLKCCIQRQPSSAATGELQGSQPLVESQVQRQPSSAATGELQGSQPLVQSQEVHTKRPRGRPRLLPSGRSVRKHLKKEKTDQQCHDLCASASEGRLSKGTVSGEEVLERCSSLPVVEVESLNENAGEGQSSRNKPMDEASGKSVLKALVPYMNSEQPASPQDSTAPPACDGNSIGSFPLASLDDYGQNKVSTSQNGTEVERTATSVLFQIPSAMRVYNSPIDNQIHSPVDNPIERVEHVDGASKPPTSQCGTKVGKTVSSVLHETPTAMRLYSSPPGNTKKRVNPFDRQRKAPTSLRRTKVVQTISSVLLETTSAARVHKSKSKKRVEPVDGQRKTPSSPCGTKVGKTFCSALLETPSAMSKYNTADDNSKKGVEPVDGQRKAPTSPCGTKVGKTINSVLLETPSAMRIYNSADDNSRGVEPVDGQRKAPTSPCGTKVGKTISSVLLETPSAMRIYNSPADNPKKLVESVEGQSTAPTSQCGMEVYKTISSVLLPNAMRIYNSSADNPKKLVDSVDGQIKAPTSQCGTEVSKTISSVLFPSFTRIYNSPADNPKKRVEPVDGQSKAPASQCGTEVDRTISSVLLPSVMRIYNSPADDPKKLVEPIDGQSKAPASQCGTEVDSTISSVLLKTSSTMRISNSRADNQTKRVELNDGQSEPPTSQRGKKVGKSMTKVLFKTPGDMCVYNSPADDPMEHEEHVDGQSKAPTSQCDTEVDKSISSLLLETPSAMRIYTSSADNPTKRGKPVDGQSTAPAADYAIKAEKTILETPPALIKCSFLTNDPTERVKPIINTSDPSSILDAIVSKHGDIAKDCTLKSPLFKSALLCGICNVAQELHNMKPDNIQSTRLEEFYAAIQDAEGVKIDVNWLRQTLDEISKIKDLIMTSEKFKDEERRSAEKANSYEKILQTKRGKMEELQSKMEDLQSEIKDVEKKLESENLKIDKLRGTIEGIKSSSQQVVRVI